MSSRKISDLLPHVQPHAYAWLHKCFERGIDVIITCTLRTQEEQDELCDCVQKEVGYPHYPQYPVYPHYPYWSPYSIPTDPSEPYKITSEFNYGGVVTC